MMKQMPDMVLDPVLGPLAIAAQLPKGKVPPVESWQPDFSGNLDMRIARDGTWHYLGSPIKRHRMVKLFASVLKRDEDGYLIFAGRLKRFIKSGGEMISLPALESPFQTKFPQSEDGPRAAVKIAASASTTGLWHVRCRIRPWGQRVKCRVPRAAMEGSAMEGAQRWQTVEAAVAGGEPEGTGTGGRSMRSRASWEAKSSAWLKAMMGG
jgi:hypothetical protein